MRLHAVPPLPRRALAASIACLILLGCASHASQPEATSSDAKPAMRSEPDTRRTATLVMGGDLLWHNTVWQSARADHAVTGRGRGGFDFEPMFAQLKPLIRRADVALCHEEVPFARPGQPLQSYPVFAAPRQIAPWIARMGFDGCTTASNHAVDQDWEGLKYTADLFDDNGVAHIGTFRSRAERRRPVILDTDDGVRIGVVAGTYGLNGFPVPEGRPWSVSLWDAKNLLWQAQRAREAGADIVVVHFHGGTEYDHLPNAEQVSLVERLTKSPYVDLVLGDHAHVVQPITKVNGKWVAYGMGNMIAQQESTEQEPEDSESTEQEPEPADNSSTGKGPITWGNWEVVGRLQVSKEDFTNDYSVVTRVKNTGDDSDSGLFTVTILKGDEILGTADCSTAEADSGAEVTASCISLDRYDGSYTEVVIEDMF